MPNRCLYISTFKEFLETDKLAILGTLHNNYHGDISTSSDEAWMGEIEIMQRVLIPWKEENARVIFEFEIPRFGKRVDVILLLRGLIFCIEFKVGKKEIKRADLDQVLDYALDLKNFHLYSQKKKIVPILVPSKCSSFTIEFKYSGYRNGVYNDGIFNPLISGESNLQQMISNVLEFAGTQEDIQLLDNWIKSPYSPTPTIIEAARSLYENHSVEDITIHEADTTAATNTLLDIIQNSKEKGQKSICFVTGVPGAGKTLVGLDVAIKQTYKTGSFDKENGAVYLSGNGPLVAILVEALARDNVKKLHERQEKKNKSDAEREVREFIQIIHRYRDNMLAKIKNPIENGIIEIDPDKAVRLEGTGYGEVEHVAIFDEAQRSWTHKRIADYLKRGGTYGNKLKVANFPMSEAEFMIWSLDQREDWAVIICLVGGGQEIHDGEAGIGEWIKAIYSSFPHWQIYLSSQLTDPEYAEGHLNELLQNKPNVNYNDSLHLSVGLRTFRAEDYPSFINSFLAFKREAYDLYKRVKDSAFEFIITRDINKARAWLRGNAKASEQTGMLVSKTAARYQPLALHVLETDIDAMHWFLEDKTDVRSSNFLEDAITEIQVQGLELDYACVVWDADVRCNNHKWTYHKLSIKNKWVPNPNWKPDTKWILENDSEKRKYMLNAYRVLLTRARKGLVVCIPEGNPEDATRLPEFYEGIYRYFKELGVEEL